MTWFEVFFGKESDPHGIPLCYKRVVVACIYGFIGGFLVAWVWDMIW